MRITQDLRDLAREQAGDVEAGLAAKAREFRERGGEIYLRDPTPA
jgi:hypothetical protein